MCAIAINRFFAITKPFLFTTFFAPKHIRIMIVFLWLLPFLATVPPLAGWGYYAFQPGKAFCFYPFNVNIVYTVLVEVLFIVIPTNVIIFCYKRCYTAMKQNNRRVAGMTEGRGGSQIGGLRKAQESRATRTMMTATAGYMICWVPVAIIDFADVFTGLFGFISVLLFFFRKRQNLIVSCICCINTVISRLKKYITIH